MDNNYIETKFKYIRLKTISSKEIYFIRHGKTSWNELGKTQGQEADIELNDIGIKEAVITGKYLEKYRTYDKKFDCIISSPMLRCQKTATIIAKELDFTNKIIYNDNIKEVKKGNMSGLTNNDELMMKLNKYVIEKMKEIADPIDKYEIEESYKAEKFYNKIIEDNKIDITGVETARELLDRVNRFIKFLQETKYKKIIVISHSGLLDILLKTIFRINVLPKGDMKNGKNCSICYCRMTDNEMIMVSPQNTEHLILQ